MTDVYKLTFTYTLKPMAGESGSRMFLAPWSRSRLKKNPGAGAATKKKGAGAAKNMRLLS